MYKLSISLLFVMFLEGCGGHSFDCQISAEAGGMYLCFENEELSFDISERMIEETVSITQNETRKHYPQVTDLRNRLEQEGTTVFFTRKNLVMSCEPLKFGSVGGDIMICETDLAGSNTNGNMIVVEDHGCSSLKILSHEVLHFVEVFYLNELTNEHKTPHMFNAFPAEDNPENEPTIETLVKKRIHEMCYSPNSYSWTN